MPLNTVKGNNWWRNGVPNGDC